MRLRLAPFLWLSAVIASAQTVAVSPYGKPQYFSNTGAPLSGGKLYTYTGGTTNLLPTFTDSTGIVQNADPIILDSTGRPPFGIFLGTGTYKFVLQDSLSNTLWTLDGVSANSLPSNNVNIPSGGTFTMQPGSSSTISASLVPGATNIYNLGSGIGASWNIGYINSINSNAIVNTGLISTATLNATGLVKAGVIYSGLTSSDLSLGTGGMVAEGSLNSVTLPVNASVIGISAVPGLYTTIYSSKSGTGTNLPMTFWTAQVNRLTLDNSGVLYPTTNLGVTLGSTTNRWGAIYTGTLNIGGTITPPSGAGALDGTQTCAMATHIASLTVSQGLITGITCN